MKLYMCWILHCITERWHFVADRCHASAERVCLCKSRILANPGHCLIERKCSTIGVVRTGILTLGPKMQLCTSVVEQNSVQLVCCSALFMVISLSTAVWL